MNNPGYRLLLLVLGCALSLSCSEKKEPAGSAAAERASRPPASRPPDAGGAPAGIGDIVRRGLEASTGVERFAAVNALAAIGTEDAHAGLLELYDDWVAKKGTGEGRRAILETFAALPDTVKAEEWILRAISLERLGPDAFSQVNRAGQLLAVSCWKREAPRIEAARAAFLATPSPPVQYALMVGLVMARPPGLAGDLLRAYASITDPMLKANLVLNSASLGDARTTFELVADAIDRPLTAESRQFFTCAIGALANLSRDSSVRSDAVRELLAIARRPDMDADVFRLAVEAVERLDPESLHALVGEDGIASPDLRRILAETIERADRPK